MPTATNQQKIAGLYVAFFGRAPDAEGLTYWAELFAEGATVRNLASGFAGHPVFDEVYGQLETRQFVEAVYQNVLGAAGEAGGVDYWVARIDEGLGRHDMVADFVDTALTVDVDQMLARGELTQAEHAAATQRQATLHNKADVGIHFAGAFGEASNLGPDTNASDRAALQADQAFLLAQSAMASVTADPDSKALATGVIDAAADMLDTFLAMNGNSVPLVDATEGAPDTIRPSGSNGIDLYLFSAANFDAGDEITLSQLVSFDRLYVGNYQVNENGLGESDDGALEFFLTQEGSNVRLSLEMGLAAASASEPQLVDIVLTGTTVAAVSLADGLIGTS